MKKYLSIFILAFTVIGCSNESDLSQPKQEVDVTLDYSFIESGSMSRAGSNVYTNFYNKYIKTKQLTPKNFELTFKNKETGAVATIQGNWDKKHSFRLLTGEYEVTGTSHPSVVYYMSCIDSVYLSFKQNVSITNSTEDLILTANYDSYMLMFDKGDKTKIEYRYTGGGSNSPYEYIPLKNIDDIYYSFFCQKRANINDICITRDKKLSIINLDKTPFEKGKYYYFNDLNNSFNIPPMEEGN